MSDPRDDAADADGAADDAQSSAGTGSAATPTGKRPTGKRRAATRSGEAAEKSVNLTAAPAKRLSGQPDRKGQTARKLNVFARLLQFLREVVAELRKVIWPNRKQMVVYTTVVLVFVVFITALISGLDIALIQGVRWIFA